MFNSLQQRLLISAFFLLLIFLGAASYVLDAASFESIKASEEKKLIAFQSAFITKAEIENNRVSLPRKIRGLEDFNIHDSLFFAVIYAQDGQIWWQSKSSDWEEDLDLFFSEGGELAEGERKFDKWRGYFYSNRRFIWEVDNNLEISFQIVIFEKPDAINAQRNTFRNQMGIGLIIITLLLMFSFALVIFWGLSPLRRLAIDVKRIKQGKT